MSYINKVKKGSAEYDIHDDRVDGLSATVGDETSGLVKDVDDLQTAVAAIVPGTKLYKHSISLGSGFPQYTFIWIDTDSADYDSINATVASNFNNSLIQVTSYGPIRIGRGSGGEGISISCVSLNFQSYSGVASFSETKLDAQSNIPSGESEEVTPSISYTYTSLENVPTYSHSVTPL